MTRDAFITAYLDTLVGLLLRAYADVLPRLAVDEEASLGRRMIAQQKRAKQLLGQMYDALTPPAAVPADAKFPRPA